MHLITTIVGATLLGAKLVSASPVGHETAAVMHNGLHAEITARGKIYFGTATSLENDPKLLALLSNTSEIGQLTPENAMKWEAIQPGPGQWSWDGADALVNFAGRNKQQIRCHNLVWHQALPEYVQSGGMDNETLIKVMQDHIAAVVGRYRGKCLHWDVVNEAIDDDGKWRKSVWYNTTGLSFIPLAFQAAAKADPTAKLYYNDYNIESSDSVKLPKVKEIINLVRRHGQRIDGVGLQSHLEMGKINENDLRGVLDGLAGMGVDTAITELDIRYPNPWTVNNDEKQGDDYGKVARACLMSARCQGITLWGPSDRYSWLSIDPPASLQGWGQACPWDWNFIRKAAYWNMWGAWGK